MKQDALDTMSVKELTELQARVANRIATARETEKAEIRDKVEQLITRAGMSVAEVFGKLRPASRAKAAPKYRDPASGQMWSGRGRPPLWMPKKKTDWNRLAL